MEIIKIPEDAVAIVSSSSKGDQSKWRIGNRWVKQNSRAHEVLLSQLRDPALQRLLIQGRELDD